jgi:carboxyl-terminal processing protease
VKHPYILYLSITLLFGFTQNSCSPGTSSYSGDALTTVTRKLEEDLVLAGFSLNLAQSVKSQAYTKASQTNNSYLNVIPEAFDGAYDAIVDANLNANDHERALDVVLASLLSNVAGKISLDASLSTGRSSTRIPSGMDQLLDSLVTKIFTKTSSKRSDLALLSEALVGNLPQAGIEETELLELLEDMVEKFTVLVLNGFEEDGDRDDLLTSFAEGVLEGAVNINSYEVSLNEVTSITNQAIQTTASIVDSNYDTSNTIADIEKFAEDLEFVSGFCILNDSGGSYENCSLNMKDSKMTVSNLNSLNSGSFVISSETSSFLLSTSALGTAKIVRLTSPSGRDEVAYLESKAAGITSFGDGPYENYLVPMRPDIVAEAGTWNYQVQGANALKLTVREDAASSKGIPTIVLQPYIASSQNFDLSDVWQRVLDLYTLNNLQVIIANPKEIEEAQYHTVSSSFFDAETSALVSQGGPESVNLFLVDDFSDGGILGIASGIPGSLGIEGSHNGVLVSLGSHQIGFSLDKQLLAETIVHEAGHLLGLWHPTEDNGVEFDPLDDTPECRKANYDSNRNGQVSAEECVGNGAENIMFWASWNGGEQNQLTDDQKIILQHSPLVKLGKLSSKDKITLTYPVELSATVAAKASLVNSTRDYVELKPECQKSSTLQSIDLILAQGCVNFQSIHYRPAFLPNNLDGLSQISDYVNIVRQSDRFSYYFEPVTFSENTQALSGGRSYIGFTYAVNDGDAVISDSNPFLLGAIYPFTRAWWDGLQAGDRLIAVDGVQISGRTVEEVRDLLPKTEAATTTLTLLRDGNQIPVQTASETHLSRSLGSTNQIAYLNLREYTTVSADRIRDDYLSLVSAGSGGTGGVILDLRQNGGGSLWGAWELTDYLSPSSVDNQVMFSLQQQSQTTDYGFSIYPSNLGITDKSKFVILIDAYSASASEVTSAALKDLGIATLMGGTTYGKGVGQNVVGLLDGSGVYITSFELLSPLGNSWHDQGVSPDYSLSTVLPATPTDDTMLQVAIDFLETGSVSQSKISRRTIKSQLSLSVPAYTHPWDGGSRIDLQ